MLKVDLSPLAAGARLRIDTRVPSTDPLWEGAGPDLMDGLAVHLEARQSGEDVLVRGTLGGEVGMVCRRCLDPVRVRFDEPVTLLYRPGADPGAGREEIYTFGERAREIDLGPAIREHALLAVPEYGLCREDCAGLCPHCGANLNQARCDCAAEEMDERWAALRRYRQDG